MIGIAGCAITKSDSARRRDGDRCAVFGAHVANGAGFDQETCLRGQNRHHSQVCSGRYCLQGSARFRKRIIRLWERDRSVSKLNLLRLEGVPFVTAGFSVLPRFSSFANDACFDQRRLFLGQNRRHLQKNGGVGIGACVVGGGLCCSCFRSNAASCGARLVCCCGSMAALRFVCCLKGALHEFGRYSAY